MSMSYYSGTSEPPEISQGSDAEGQYDEPVVSATTATVTFEETSSSSGVSAIVYFGLCWIVLLSLIVALVCVLVECRCRRDQKLEQQLQSSPATPHDVEVAEAVVEAVSSRSRKIQHAIGLTILFIGSLFGLGLSIFSILTCEFVTLEESVTLDTLDSSFADPLSITIYTLGLWKVDLTSNFALSGCVSTVNLPLLDARYNFAKASAVIGAVFGGLCLLLLLCLVMNREFTLVVFKGRNLLVCFYSLACLFQLTTLTLFGSHYCESSILEYPDGNCKPSFGVVASVSAALFWMLEVVAVTCLPLSDT